MIKKFTYLKALCISGILFAGITLSAQESIIEAFDDIPDATTNFNEAKEYGYVTGYSLHEDTVRSGSKSFKMAFPSGTSGHHLTYTVDSIKVPAQKYVHVIAYVATSDSLVGQAAATFDGGSGFTPTPSFVTLNKVNQGEFERKTFSKINALQEDRYCKIRIRCKSLAAASNLYYDDVVLYWHDSAKVDLSAPDSATGFAYASGTGAGEIKFTWTEGEDTLTGVNKTIILRTTDSAAVPGLMPQVAYSDNSAEIKLKKIGNWDVIGSVDAGILEYKDKMVLAGTKYYYAVVHADLAYNYSPAHGGSGFTATQGDSFTKDVEKPTFRYYAVDGSLQLLDLTVGKDLAIYNISGVLVHKQVVTSSNHSVALQNGLYIVRVDNEVTKVIVK